MSKKKQTAKDIIIQAQKTHLHWFEFIKEHPEFPTEHIGDIKHHKEWIKKYDIVLDSL